MRGEDGGEKINDRKSVAPAKVQGSGSQQVQALRAAPRLHAEVRDLPDLF